MWRAISNLVARLFVTRPYHVRLIHETNPSRKMEDSCVMSVEGGKKVSEQAIIGETGVNLIERIVLAMGCGWHRTNQAVEVGIDGEIELVHPETRVATNSVVRVQSRAT